MSNSSASLRKALYFATMGVMEGSLENKSNVNIDIKKVLETEGVRIEESEPFVTGPLAWEGFEQLSPVTQNFLKQLEASAKHYLSGVLFRDSFGTNHEARRRWRTEMKEKYGQAFVELDDRNKRRGNLINHLKGFLEGFVLFLDKENVHTPQSEAVREIMKRWPEDFNEKYAEGSDEQKLQMVRDIEDLARNLLKAIAPIS